MEILQPGSRLGPYEILGLLGEGGMGQVWKARDTRLNRVVAIKRLSAPHAARFGQEARAIAALNHPHICQIHDVGPDYLVLEYVDGRPLQGPMAADQAVRLAIQIADALEAAHAQGILHRDLKPANIMVTASGNAKLLDFGLATTRTADADVTRTVEGVVVGTAAYMSPEQAEGKTVDARSDMFSFGAVLYEMLAGRRAFGGHTTAQVFSAILRDDPPPLQAAPHVDRIARRCLAKNSADRFQSMRDVRVALDQSAATSGAVQPSIAVLPFVDMSPAKDNEYFGDGLAEEVINALAQLPGLKVIARTSAFAFKGQNTDVRRIAETLGVTNVLEGSVRKAGNRLRVTAQLIAASDGSHLWSERYDRELADVFEVQDDIATAITTALRLSAEPAAPRRHTPDTPAYEAYLKARHFLAKETPESLESSRRYLEEAIALDPQFAMAHGWLSSLYVHLVGFVLRSAHDAIPLARAHAQRAVEIDPSLSEAHTMLGVVASVYDYNWAAAERSFRLAMAHEPVPSLTRFHYAVHYLMPLGRAREAAEQIERGLRDDPLNVVRRTHYAMALAAAGRPADARAAVSQALEIDDRSWIGHLTKSTLELVEGQLAAALASTERACTIAPWSPAAIGAYAGVLARSGETERAQDLILKLGDGHQYGAPFAFFWHFLARQDIAQAAEWARRAIDQRDLVVPFFIRHPIADSLRASAHWAGLATLMNLTDT